jgi:hypothetical protein
MGRPLAAEIDMSVYTVHAPPPKADESTSDPERFVFVRDGFYFWALLLTPLWMLRRRLWLVLLGYIVVAAALHFGLAFIGATAAVKASVMALLSLLVGFEAATLRRFTLSRRGWQNLGVVVGDDLDTAERRFYDAWVQDESSVAPAPSAPFWRPPASSEVIGLFPEPGAQR